MPAQNTHVATPEVVISAESGHRGAIAEWVATFAGLWAAPAQQLDRIMDIFGADIRLVAPGYVPTVGREAGRQAFAKTLAALPDLTGQVLRWSAQGEVLFVEMTFEATIGGRRVRWHNVDRFLFREGYAVERVAYFNPTKVRLAFLSSFKGIRQFMKLRWGR
ncbi:nuclear transport factor 2 family protein [Hymenobacter sp.]|uniref:nuclear transport factor 2 family protein n=1 Tax=Hymenobacter sp. TaxID=1898978 RepID=UPI00286C6433|nr:nuclear transport factor 2 family protein [Hymenobacter sp.]